MRIIRHNSLEELSVEELRLRGGAMSASQEDLELRLRDGHERRTIDAEFRESTYFRLAELRQSGDINSNPSDTHYMRHLWRMRALLKTARGLSLDVGCGDVGIGAHLLPPHCTYVGLDPFGLDKNPPRLLGFAECLPFRDASIDTVIFNTSLDHVLDYVTALDEARRVLTSEGHLYIASLIWSDNYSLVRDDVHFHHFKYFELAGALQHSGFQVDGVAEYAYKTDTHRVGAYIAASAL